MLLKVFPSNTNWKFILQFLFTKVSIIYATVPTALHIKSKYLSFFIGICFGGNNVLFSAISLRRVLALLYQGFIGGSEREFQHILPFINKTSVRDQYHNIFTWLQVQNIDFTLVWFIKHIFQDNANDGYILNIASTIFLSSTISSKPEFTTVAKDFFKRNIQSINFSERNSINAWVRDVTKGKITHLVKLGSLF